ncbi:unnamed protein product [Rotaria sp. Silwood2]|nr:unnamed protein product [Rotaria sp. Silwood2]
MSSLETAKVSKDIFPSEIHRVAIDSTGRVGSLYDGYRDCILQRLEFHKIEETFNITEPRQCELINGQHDQNPNILKIMRIQEELRLSLLLNISKKPGTDTMIDYCQPINKCTRFIQYSSLKREEKLPDNPANIKIVNRLPTFSTAATHIITKVYFGVSLTVILQLPNVPNTVEAIDKVLITLCNRLQNHQSAYLLTTYEKNVLEKIVHTRVYSNIPHLKNLTKIWDVCCLIQQNQCYLGTYPISYTLRSMKDFFSEYDGGNAQFNILPEEFNEAIENYVFQLIVSMKTLENSMTRDMPKFLCEYLKRQFNNIQTQWLDVKKKFTNEIERLSNLVVEIRSCRTNNFMIHDTLYNNEQMAMQTSVTDLTQYLKCLEKKEYFIRNLHRRRFQYLNADVYKIDKTDNEKRIAHKLVNDNQYYRIICSNDCLNENNINELEKLISNLTEELKHNPNLYLIYADFSNSSFPLANMMVLQSPKTLLK